ncbi:Toxin YoeB [Streptomyces sp. YIM 130001]|nr:Toxin YoeB [Streptomyces sp. YIM 130001]
MIYTRGDPHADDDWSRRITDEHRLVYKIVEDEIRVAACRYHYER